MINSKLWELDISTKNKAHWQSNKYASINSWLLTNPSSKQISWTLTFNSLDWSNCTFIWTVLTSKIIITNK